MVVHDARDTTLNCEAVLGVRPFLLPVTFTTVEFGGGEPQMTRADLVEEISRVVEMSRKDSQGL